MCAMNLETQEFAARLADSRRKAGFKSPREAARAFGWNENTYKSRENGVRGIPSHDDVQAYARAFKVPYLWLLTGVADDQGAARTRVNLVKSYDPDEPERVSALDTTPNTVAAEFPEDAIKELAARGGMGAGQVITTSYTRDGVEITQSDAVKDEYWKFPTSFVRSALGTTAAALIAVECQGDSMQPTLQAGERVWVDTTHKKPSPDGIYAIRDPLEEIIVKRLELTDDTPPRVAILSDNPNHGRRVYDLDQIVVVGKVVCSLRLF